MDFFLADFTSDLSIFCAGPTIFNKSFHTLPIHIMKTNVISQLPEPPQSSCTNYMGNSKYFLTQPTSSY